MGLMQSYVCDRCGHEQLSDRKFTDTDRWMFTVTVISETGFTRGPRNVMRADRKGCVFWCQNCCQEVGVLAPPEPVAKTQEPPSLEDMIREIVREEVGHA